MGKRTTNDTLVDRNGATSGLGYGANSALVPVPSCMPNHDSTSNVLAKVDKIEASQTGQDEGSGSTNGQDVTPQNSKNKNKQRTGESDVVRSLNDKISTACDVEVGRTH